MAGKTETVPLRKRLIDALFVAFFAVNAVVVTYTIDIEQLVIGDPAHFSYPFWPPPPVVDFIHWYGRSFDPLLMARPAFWQMTIWIDVLLFGPFYLAGIYAFARSRAWIRIPALAWSGMMAANVLIILMEERYGVSASPNFGVMLAAYLPWLLAAVAMILRMRGPEAFPPRGRRDQRSSTSARIRQ
ncbi:emopamil-binding family protein [Actinoplanes sp. NPDC089786]|uniref:EXPERA domain-containing protein n=1 Tax=Actinoplanes sp. NPDC089786 TaxID=3155185 RepID=UPI003419BA13